VDDQEAIAMNQYQMRLMAEQRIAEFRHEADEFRRMKAPRGTPVSWRHRLGRFPASIRSFAHRIAPAT